MLVDHSGALRKVVVSSFLTGYRATSQQVQVRAEGDELRDMGRVLCLESMPSSSADGWVALGTEESLVVVGVHSAHARHCLDYSLHTRQASSLHVTVRWQASLLVLSVNRDILLFSYDSNWVFALQGVIPLDHCILSFHPFYSNLLLMITTEGRLLIASLVTSPIPLPAFSSLSRVHQ